MKKIIRFFDMTVTIPMKDGETAEEIKDKVAEAIETVGSRFTTYKTEIKEEEEEEIVEKMSNKKQYVPIECEILIPVVRCKDCKWYDERISMCDNCGLPREQTFFCADGIRKDS